MAFTKGQSGNPKGRPAKSRALTEILKSAGNATLPIEVETRKRDGTVVKETRVVAKKRLVAQLAWEVVATGKATFPDGSVLAFTSRDWLETVKWIYTHIDGPAHQAARGTEDDPIHQVTRTADEWKRMETERLAQAETTLALYTDAEGGDA